MPMGFLAKYTQKIEDEETLPWAAHFASLFTPQAFMASESKPPHFLLFPVMAQGHLIPMVDLAKLLAQRGVKITLITTPQNASRIDSFLARATQSGLQIQTLQLQFPSERAGLPEGCENFDSLPSLDLIPKFLTLTTLLCRATEELFEQLSPRPSCIVSDMALPWTIQLADKFKVPRLVLYSLSCLYLLVMANLQAFNGEKMLPTSESEKFVVPNLPDRVEVTKSQLVFTLDPDFLQWGAEMVKADHASYGFIFNTFDGLEPKYLEGYKKAIGSDKVWCVGPVSLCDKDTADMAVRGNKAAIDQHECLQWLDRQETGSVVYAALGSICNPIAAQIMELGLALEASKRPFIWVIRQAKASRELEKWLSEYGFEEKTKGRGVVIHGWAPQVLILSHPAIGAFVTHCGWNSTIEGISAGVPMVAWPLFADQILNEKVIVQVLRVGVSVGVEKCFRWGAEEEVGVQVKKEAIGDAIEKLMGGEGKEEMRRRVRDLAEKAKAAMEEGGSSHLNVKMLIDDIMHHSSSRF